MTHTVLIVDDSKLARMSIAKVLGALHPDWRRIEATNAADALEQAKRLSPEFVLVDFNMPGKDGVTLAAELHALNPKINVAVVSANRQTEVLKRTQAAGAAFLAKPLIQSALAEFLSAAAGKRNAGSR